MDVNGTRFHLLLGRDDWARATPGPTRSRTAVVWSEERGGLSLRPLRYRFPRPDALTLADRRGNGRDGFGHVYAIGADERTIEIVTADGRRSAWWPPAPENAPCRTPDGTFGPAEPAPQPRLRPLRGLAVTTHQYLVVGVPEPPRLLVFDLHAGGPPAVLPWPGPEPFRPFDLAPRPDGGVWLLDADPFDPAVPPRYWGIDRFFRLERRPSPNPSTFRPAAFGQGPDCTSRPEEGVPPPTVTDADGWPLEGRPVAIEGLPDGTVLVLEVDAATGATGVARYRDDVLLGRADLRTPLLESSAERPGAPGSLPELPEPEAPDWIGYDVAFVPETARRRGETRGTLYAVGQDGNQAFAFTLVADEDGLRATPRDPYYPLRLFGGRGLLADRGTALYDLAEPDVRWLPVAAQPKPRYEVEGMVETAAFDGREPGCVWHRLLMEACLPAGTAVRVESRAADDEERLGGAPWQTEPAPYERGRGAELPYYRPFTPDERRRDGIGTWELLFQRAQGRYLQLRLTLSGTGRSTPRVYAARVHYPRFSYLREYLPDVYQEDADSAHFLDRFLANTEGFFTDIEGRIAGAEALFDERLLAPDYLDWLAGWLGTVLDPAFDEARRRLFLRHAVALYAERGTLRGLVRALRLALDPCPTDALFEPGALDCDLGRQACEERHAARYGVRVRERFLTRRPAGVAASDGAASDGAASPGPRLLAKTEAWAPDQGATRLHQLFRAFLEKRHGALDAATAVWATPFSAIRFPPLPPSGRVRLDDWRAFVKDELKFTYAEVGGGDLALYRDFLERRYRSVERLNARYSMTYTAFSAVALPSSFPSGEPRLSDWIQFVSLVVPIERAAARFDVLVPIEAGTEAAAQADRIAFVERLVEREKPAHTEFEVQPYWALFRVGEARLGLDTLLDRGSRYLPLLLPAALGAVTVGGNHPWDVPDRFVTGRDRPGRTL